jgi:hypothetical protein
MPNETLYSSAYWLDKAEEARTRSGTMHDMVAAQTLLRVAQFYELMAKRAAAREARLADKKR